MNFTQALLGSDPFDFSETNKNLFLRSFRENFHNNFEKHEFTRKFWKHLNFHPDQIQTEEDLYLVPPVMVHLFKEHELCSASAEEIVLSLTSSGTGGQKSRQFLNQESLDNVKKLAYNIHRALGITDEREYNYLCFTYDPHLAKDLGTAFTDELLTSFTGKRKVYYAIQWDDQKQDFYLNEAGTLQALMEFEKSSIPTRILGFPALLYDLIKKNKLHLNLGKDSWLQTGGGWKGHADVEIHKSDFRNFIFEHLGIPIQNQRDLFGMVEHGIPYVDCERGKLHIPNYSRVFVRSPYDLSLRKKGERGLIQFLCSYNTSYPAPSLLTTDYGRVGTCDCALGGEVLILEGRAGVDKHKGCALKALELVER
jgi:phenylacetate-coenzyme A ligase PaaK-like adenylate-forming protein